MKMTFVPYDDGTVSDVEYEEVNFDELTSCYTYNPLFTSIKSQSKTVKDENNFIQWISPNEEIHFEKSTNEGYLDLIWIYGKPIFNLGSGSKEGTKIVGENEKINVITKMDLKNYRYVVNQFFTTLTDDNSNYTKYTRDGQTYTKLEENEKIHGGAYYWLNITNDKAISDIYPVIRYVDTNGEKMLFYPHLITELNAFRNAQTTGIIVNTKGVAESTDNTIYFMMHDIDKSYNYPRLSHEFNVGGDNDITYIWYNETQGNTQLYPVLSYEKFKEVLALLGVYFRIGGIDYLGYMDSSGQTTGDYLTEENWDKSSQHNSDTINNFTKHEPPRTDIEGDDIDEIGINDFPISDIGGLARYYAIDRFQLDELQADFKNSTSGIPLDAGQFVIGLYQLPIDIPSFCTTSQEKIVLGKLETNAVGKKLLTVNRRVHLGEYFISANCGNNFLDYAPYTEIKLYIPYCGMVELPPNLFINSTVSVDMIIDIISGSCKGIVMYNNTFYTSISGSLMCSLPLSLEQCATKSLSIINSANSIMSGIIFGNKNYSALNTVTTLGEAMIENNNIAPSHISGNMDSVVNFYDPQCCILFMTYPEVNMGDIGKTHGKVCNYQDTLNNCHGYTVVNNPHLEIKCTNTEKDEITKLLEQGVILP